METCSSSYWSGVGLANLLEHIAFYGSEAQPKKIFGEDTPELDAFYEAAQTIAPGAWDLLQELLASWQHMALSHDWIMPDGFDVRIKVLSKRETRIHLDELDNASFNYEYYVNEGLPQGHPKAKSNAANVTHAVDGYVLRSMHRRCNYDREVAEFAKKTIEHELDLRKRFGEPRPEQIAEFMTPKIRYYLNQYERSTVADIVIMPYLDQATVTCLSTKHLKALHNILSGMLQYVPFSLVTIHDEFKAHPKNINWVRWQYKEILAEIADSNLLDDILSQLHKTKGTFPKMSTNLSRLIRNSNYGLC